MEIIFAFDKNHDKNHFLVNHPNVSEREILEVFANKHAVIKEKSKKSFYRVIGYTKTKRFLIIIGVYGKNGKTFKVITAYPANKKHLILYKNEVSKYD